ncbi:MAG: PD-(D/E)XK nuclease domain-containing protein, partial [Verrucomicrobiota bacterium]|nr:PD-(D/E)XK nuclease domain-containing protein [Verrucomicrobiota bacterium]
GSSREGVYTQYTLGFPNDEVRNAFSKAVSRTFSALPAAEHASLLRQIVEALRADDVNDMLDALSCFFANIPANITVRREKYYQTLFYAVFVLIGARTHAECWTNRGRVDAVVETPRGVYVFEFKLDGTAADALAQIREKGYHEKYLRCGKRVTLVGAAFDAGMRNLTDRQIEVAAG